MRALLALAFVLSSHAFAQKIECEWMDSTGRIANFLLILYPVLGATTYQVEWHVIETDKDEFQSSHYYEGTGAIDRRYLGGKLDLLEPATGKSLGEVEFTEPADVDPSLIPRGGKVPGRVREFRPAGSPAIALNHCIQELPVESGAVTFSSSRVKN